MKKIFTLLFSIYLLFGCELFYQSKVEIRPGFETGEQSEFLDDLQERTFRFFWETTNPENGLTPDRYPDPPFSSIAAVGFALPAYGVGAERGYISRSAAANRTLNTLKFFWNAPHGSAGSGITGYNGFYYHFLHMDSGERYQTVELSTIDTALLLAGVLFSQSYFDGSSAEEQEIRALADSLYQRANWQWFRGSGEKVRMGWYPERGFGQAVWEGYDESMILIVLALGSPTYPLPESAWTDYTSTYRWDEFYGHEYVQFSPLFGYQYSHIFIDFQEIQDKYMRAKGIDYFENSRRATLAQRAYAVDNPREFVDYGKDFWGLTACDGPANVTREFRGDSIQFHSYWARGVSKNDIRDDGTVAPTAIGGSVPFAPEICIPALMHMKNTYGNRLYQEYGFLDAINPSFTFTEDATNRGHVDPKRGWVDDNYLGIDQGPILLMIENYRSGLIWDVMKKNNYILRGLERAGFSGSWLN